MEEERLFCKNCGKELRLDQRFCGACGTPVNNAKPEDAYDKQENLSITQPPYISENTVDRIGNEHMVQCAKCKKMFDKRYPHTCETNFASIGEGVLNKVRPKRELSKYPDINNLKQSVNSWLFLALLITYSVYALASFIDVFSNQNSMFYTINSILSAFDISSFGVEGVLDMLDLDWLIDATNGMSVLINIVKFVPTGIIVYGIWDFYVTCIDEKRQDASTKGICLIQLMYRALFVVNIVIGVIIAVICIIGAIVAQDSFLSEEITVLCIVALVVDLTYYSVKLVYFKKVVDAISLVRDTFKAKSYPHRARISKYIIVLHFFFCAGCLIKIALNNNVFSSVLELTILVLVNILFIKFNNEREITSPYKAVNLYK